MIMHYQISTADVFANKLEINVSQYMKCAVRVQINLASLKLSRLNLSGFRIYFTRLTTEIYNSAETEK